MGFIKGRAYPIILAMAKDGNAQAKQLLDKVDSMSQDEVEGMISELFGNGGSAKKTNDPERQKLENKYFANLAVGDTSKTSGWKKELEDEEFENEIKNRTGGKYSTKQKFGDFKTAVQSDEDIPEVDAKPFKYKSQGKEKVTVKQSQPFTEEQKNEFNQNYAAGVEVTNDVTGETFVAGKQETKQNNTNDKQKKLQVILDTNPALNDYSTWIREEKDILDFDELDLSEDFTPDYTVEDMENAKKTGKIKVFSSKPIKNGNFVTPSLMEAQAYAGKNKIYEAEINVNDVAWIDSGQGQYVKMDNNKEMKDAKQAFPSLKQPTVKESVNQIAKQVGRNDGTYKIENGKPQKVDLNKGFSASFFRPEITDQEAAEIEQTIKDNLGPKYVGVFNGEGELSYNVNQNTALLMADLFNQESVWNNEIQDVVPNPKYDKNKKVDYKQAIKQLKQLLSEKKLKGV